MSAQQTWPPRSYALGFTGGNSFGGQCHSGASGVYIALLFAAQLPCLLYDGESGAAVHAPCCGPWVLKHPCRQQQEAGKVQILFSQQAYSGHWAVLSWKKLKNDVFVVPLNGGWGMPGGGTIEHTCSCLGRGFKHNRVQAPPECLQSPVKLMFGICGRLQIRVGSHSTRSANVGHCLSCFFSVEFPSGPIVRAVADLLCAQSDAVHPRAKRHPSAWPCPIQAPDPCAAVFLGGGGADLAGRFM